MNKVIAIISGVCSLISVLMFPIICPLGSSLYAGLHTLFFSTSVTSFIWFGATAYDDMQIQKEKEDKTEDEELLSFDAEVLKNRVSIVNALHRKDIDLLKSKSLYFYSDWFLESALRIAIDFEDYGFAVKIRDERNKRRKQFENNLKE